jgi:hypothetical protein
MTDQSFSSHRLAALAILNSGTRLSRKEGSFLGQIAADPNPLTARQAEWLAKLFERAGLLSMPKGGVK